MQPVIQDLYAVVDDDLVELRVVWSNGQRFAVTVDEPHTPENFVAALNAMTKQHEVDVFKSIS